MTTNPGLTDYGSPLFGSLRQAARENWQAYVDHDFVRGLGDGSLPREAFLAYLIQDYIFLLHFSRAWALAVVKSASASQMRTSAATVNALINEEIQLHIGICGAAGISEQALESASEAPENIAYTRYVMDAGLSGDLLDLLVVLAPCVFGYGEIGLRLADRRDTCADYRRWIDSYCGNDYQRVCTDVATLLEQVAASSLGAAPQLTPRWQSLVDRFDTATGLEVAFWSMGLRHGQERA